MTTKEDIILALGQLLRRCADATAEGWTYAGSAFETPDGVRAAGISVVRKGREDISMEMEFEDEDDRDELFLSLREVMQPARGAHWAACILALRADGEIRMAFEYADVQRWTTSRGSDGEASGAFIDEMFPEAATASG